MKLWKHWKYLKKYYLPTRNSPWKHQNPKIVKILNIFLHDWDFRGNFLNFFFVFLEISMVGCCCLESWLLFIYFCASQRGCGTHAGGYCWIRPKCQADKDWQTLLSKSSSHSKSKLKFSRKKAKRNFLITEVKPWFQFNSVCDFFSQTFSNACAEHTPQS